MQTLLHGEYIYDGNQLFDANSYIAQGHEQYITQGICNQYAKKLVNIAEKLKNPKLEKHISNVKTYINQSEFDPQEVHTLYQIINLIDPSLVSNKKLQEAMNALVGDSRKYGCKYLNYIIIRMNNFEIWELDKKKAKEIIDAVYKIVDEVDPERYIVEDEDILEQELEIYSYKTNQSRTYTVQELQELEEGRILKQASMPKTKANMPMFQPKGTQAWQAQYTSETYSFKQWLLITEAKKAGDIAKELLGNDPTTINQIQSIIPKDIKQDLQVKLFPIAAYYHQQQKNLNKLKQDLEDYANLIKLNKMPIIAIKDDRTVDGEYKDYLHWTEIIDAKKYEDERTSQAVKGDVSDQEFITQSTDGRIKVYKANSAEQCIILGKGQKFCISQPANTMFQSYRDTKISTFYFVYDNTRTDDLSIVVVDATQKGIELTDRKNQTAMTMQNPYKLESEDRIPSNVELYFKYLKENGIDTNIFKNIPRTQEEKLEQEKLGKSNEDLDWFKSLSPEEKSRYIGRGHLLTNEQFDLLYDNNLKFLLTQYVKIGQKLNYHQLERIADNKDLKDNYIHNRLLRVKELEDSEEFFLLKSKKEKLEMLGRGYISPEYLTLKTLKDYSNVILEKCIYTILKDYNYLSDDVKKYLTYNLQEKLLENIEKGNPEDSKNKRILYRYLIHGLLQDKNDNYDLVKDYLEKIKNYKSVIMDDKVLYISSAINNHKGLEYIKLLISYGAIPDRWDVDVAADRNMPEIVKFLKPLVKLSKGINLSKDKLKKILMVKTDDIINYSKQTLKIEKIKLQCSDINHEPLYKEFYSVKDAVEFIDNNDGLSSGSLSFETTNINDPSNETKKSIDILVFQHSGEIYDTIANINLSPQSQARATVDFWKQYENKNIGF